MWFAMFYQRFCQRVGGNPTNHWFIDLGTKILKDEHSKNGKDEDHGLNFSSNVIRWLSGFTETGEAQRSRFETQIQLKKHGMLNSCLVFCFKVFLFFASVCEELLKA